jgi:hypothetical protein
MAKNTIRTDGGYIQSNPNSTFVGVFITLRNKKLPRVFFVLKGKDLVPMTGGMVLFEKKNYKAVIEQLKLDISRLKNTYFEMVDDLVTIANAEKDADHQQELRDVLEKHGIDFESRDYEDDYEEDEEDND